MRFATGKLRGAPVLAQRRQAHLRLEELEPRIVPSVFTPAQIRHAYGFDRVAFTKNGQTVPGDGRGQTIAIVDAYDNPTVYSDLRYFDHYFGIADPPSFRQVDQKGGTNYPAANSAWAAEIALDVEWAHAIAPAAKILLVEAASDSVDDLLAAVDYARHQQNVVAVSMSWGGDEFEGETGLGKYFTTPAGHGGVTFVASAGDSGAGAEWPAAASNVLAVGGTSLRVANSAGAMASETAWSGSGGGLSAFETAPTYQRSMQKSARRSVPDVSYTADPDAGVYVFQTDPKTGGGTWYAFGGTSVGAPQWAALVAIADQGLALLGKGALDGQSQTLPTIYQLPGADFHDITAGSNGYSAKPGYDLATGRGSPVADKIIADLVKTIASIPADKGTSAGTTKTQAGTTKGSLTKASVPDPSIVRPTITEGSSYRLARHSRITLPDWPDSIWSNPF